MRRDPHAALSFIKIVMVFSGLGSAVVCVACVIFLALYWGPCASCDRPLRWWILVHTLLQSAQVPVRFVFLTKLRRLERERGTEGTVHSLEACVTAFTSTPAWRASKNVSLVTYGWFVLGIVWVVIGLEDSPRPPACPPVLGHAVLPAAARFLRPHGRPRRAPAVLCVSYGVPRACHTAQAHSALREPRFSTVSGSCRLSFLCVNYVVSLMRLSCAGERGRLHFLPRDLQDAQMALAQGPQIVRSIGQVPSA